MPPQSAEGLWLVVGLGNPGPEYATYRHNVGHMVVDVVVDRPEVRFRSASRQHAEVATVQVGGVPGIRTVVAKPRSYMNESGGPIARLLAYYRIPPERCVVVHDELDLPFGAIRLKRGGGDNGHNGLKSIRRALGTGDYFRVRVGIGRSPGRQQPVDFVLSPFAAAERAELPLILNRAADALACLLVEGLAKAQNQYHT